MLNEFLFMNYLLISLWLQSGKKSFGIPCGGKWLTLQLGQEIKPQHLEHRQCRTQGGRNANRIKGKCETLADSRIQQTNSDDGSVSHTRWSE